MEKKKQKYEPPLAYDLTHAVRDEVQAQAACKSGGTPSAATCKSGSLATAKCSTGIVSGAQCRSGSTAVYTCKSGGVPNSGI